jgi:HK97 family phage portal protein
MPHEETLTLRLRDRRTMVQRITATLAEWRASWTGLSTKSQDLGALFGAPPLASGMSVSETTALNHSAVWAAVAIISSDVAALPLIFYRRLPNDGKERYTAHPLYRILHAEPNPEMTAMVFRETLTAHLLLWGNAYAEIERDAFGRPFALWPLTPDRVTPFRETDGRLRYRVRNEQGGETILEMRDVLHIPGLGFDGLTGYSVIAKARESIGVGVAAEKFGASFFGNGSTFGGVFSHPGKLSPLAKENFTRSIEARHQGIDKAHKFILVEEGMKYESIGIHPTDAQFLETRKFQVTEVARWFQIPPHKIGDLERATFTNIEEQNLDYYRSGLRRWLVRWEQELNRKLVASSERNLQFAEHLVEGFLRGNSTARSEFYSKMFGIGALSINDIRALENQNPIGPDGDTHFIPLNFTTVERAIEGPAQAPAPPPPEPPPDDGGDDGDDTPDAAQAARMADLQMTLNQTLDQLYTTRQERDDAVVQLQTSMDQYVTASTDLEQRETLIATLRNEVALAHAQAEEVGSLTAACLEAETRVLQVRDRERDRLERVAVAHRDLIADVLQRLIDIEVARVRRHVSSPAKLMAWMRQFYDTSHEESATEALLPAMRVALAWQLSTADPHEATREIARAHQQESVEQLQDAIDACESESELHAFVAQLMQHWEQHRATASADAVLAGHLAFLRASERSES